jgi:hypothetical protein
LLRIATGADTNATAGQILAAASELRAMADQTDTPAENSGRADDNAREQLFKLLQGQADALPHCTACGHPDATLCPDDRFCRYCGAPAVKPTPEPQFDSLKALGLAHGREALYFAVAWLRTLQQTGR